MHHVVHEDDPFWRTVHDLKQVLDPNKIIAPVATVSSEFFHLLGYFGIRKEDSGIVR